MKTLALATSATSLSIDYDMPPLLEACQAIGVRAKVCDWEDPEIDWAGFDAVLLRSPWNYVDKLPEFLSWCERVTALTRLLNPLPVARWVLNKRYLADLAAHDVPTVPTRFVEPGQNPLVALRELLAAHSGAREIVIKPAVGAYSKDVKRYARSLENEAADYAARLLRKGGDVILQPYLESIDEHGETNLTYFDGVYSHAIRKGALLMPDGTVNVPTLDFRKARTADEAERAVASAALAAAVSHLGLERPLLYGRVDLVRADDGAPVVLELDLCEPSLNLSFSDGSAMRFAQAVARWLDY